MRSTTFLLIVALICGVATSATRTVSADDTPPLYASVSGPISAPVGGAQKGGRVTVMLELAAGADQAAVEQAAQALGGSVIYRTNLVYRGSAISIPAGAADRLKSIPGVAATHALPSKQRLRVRATMGEGLAEATRFVAERTASTGRGVRIGIIDSGIDYTHATFGGAGTPDSYDAIDPTVAAPGVFPTAKVAGGVDLAGESYDADGVYGSVSTSPDANPLDCRLPATAASLNRGGHGTFVAAVAAGFGVRKGMTYTGPFDTALDADTFDIAPGIAPQATLYAYKVFGCRGSTTLIASAIEKAIDPDGNGDYSDRQVDVLNIAVGSPFGGPDDPDLAAIERAVQAGVTVVVAVGDSGDVFYSIATPSNATGAISVGAVGASGLAASSSRGPQRGGTAIKPDLVAPGVSMTSAAAGTGNDQTTMDGSSIAAALVTGAAARTLQQHPAWDPARVKAALINTATPLTKSGLTYPASLAGAGVLNLAALDKVDVLAYDSAVPSPGGVGFGQAWLPGAYASTRSLTIFNDEDTTRVVQVTATAAVTEPGVLVSVPSTPIELPPHSSRDIPVSVSVNPQLLAETPDGLTQTTQGPFDRYAMAEHSGFLTVGNAEFSRVRAAHAADFPPLAFYIDGRPLALNLAATQVSDYDIAGPGAHTITVYSRGADPATTAPILTKSVTFRPGYDYTMAAVGGGTVLYLTKIEARRLNPSAALVQLVNANMRTPVDAYIDGRLVAGGLGFLDVANPVEVTPGSHTVTFYRAGSTTDVVATTQISPAAGHTWLVAATQGSWACSGSACTADLLVLTGVSWAIVPPPIALNVPFQIFPKSAALASAETPEVLAPAGATSLSLTMRNAGARSAASSPRGAQTPLVGAFELAARSPSAGLPAGLRGADIRYVGVTNNRAATGSDQFASIFFATASDGPWATPNELQIRIYLDTTGAPGGGPDGRDDFVLLVTSFGAVTSQTTNDAFFSFLYRINADGSLSWTGVPPGRYNTLPPPPTSPNVDAAPFNSSVQIQFTSFAALGLSASQPRLRYHVETYARDAGNFANRVDRVPETGSLEYDFQQAAITPINAASGVPNLRERPLFLDVDGGQVTAAVNPTSLGVRRSQDLLLVHLHNAPERQAEVVSVAAP